MERPLLRLHDNVAGVARSSRGDTWLLVTEDGVKGADFDFLFLFKPVFIWIFR